MRGARVAIITENRALIRATTRALVSAGATPRSGDFTKADAILDEEPQILLIDADQELARVDAVLARVAERNPNTRVMIFSRDLGPTVAQQVLDREVNHLVAKHGAVSVSPDLIDETEVIVTCRKLFTGEIFGLEQYLTLPGLDIRQHILRRSADRTAALEHFDRFLRELDLQQAMTAVILTVADELMMNAVFNAPRAEDGSPKYAHLDRRTQFDLEPREIVEFRYGCDGRNVVLSVADQYGALDRDIILRYLGSGLAREKGQLEPKPGGAGLGLHLVFNSITQLVFNMEVGRRTEVIAGFYVRSGFRGLRSSGQSLNVFIKP